MHEHVREDLVEIKMAGHKEVKAQHIIKINTISRKSCHPTSCEEQNVDNEQILGYWRHIIHNSQFS